VYLKKNKPKNQGIKIIKLGKKISEAQFGKTVNVYNGVRFLPLVITTSKIGRSYKSFVLSKRQGLDIHKKKKKKI
jgi:ribosomal protein S19